MSGNDLHCGTAAILFPLTLKLCLGGLCVTVIGEDLGSELSPRSGSTLYIIRMNLCDEAVLYHPDPLYPHATPHIHTHNHSAFPAFLTHLCLCHPFLIAPSPHFLFSSPSLQYCFERSARANMCVCHTGLSHTVLPLPPESADPPTGQYVRCART